MIDTYENLANAIILLAVEDYRRVLRRCKYNPCKETSRHDKAVLERFFRSDWFGILTGLDPELLIIKLRSEVG